MEGFRACPHDVVARSPKGQGQLDGRSWRGRICSRQFSKLLSGASHAVESKRCTRDAADTIERRGRAAQSRVEAGQVCKVGVRPAAREILSSQVSGHTDGNTPPLPSTSSGGPWCWAIRVPQIKLTYAPIPVMGRRSR